MRPTFICQHCQEVKDRNPRIKQGQKYCGSAACRKASRREWKRKKYSTDERYRERSLEDQRRWRKKKPAHSYQRAYRELHPDYVERNRQGQKRRNQKRRDGLLVVDLSQKIVNRNTLLGEGARAGLYAYIPANMQKIVNRNTLLITLRFGEGPQSLCGSKVV